MVNYKLQCLEVPQAVSGPFEPELEGLKLISVVVLNGKNAICQLIHVV